MSDAVSEEVPPRPDDILDDERVQYQAMTDLSDAEYATLAADIRENGVLQPVIVDDTETQTIIDGHHREAIAAHYDLPQSKRPAYIILTGRDDEEKLSRAIKQNLIGRDSTESVKSHAVKQYIETAWNRTDDGALIRPETDTEVAAKLGVSQRLVSGVVKNRNGSIIYHDRIQAREYYEDNPDASYREVAEQVDASRPTVTEWLKEDFDEGGDQEKDEEQEVLVARTDEEADKATEITQKAKSDNTENKVSESAEDAIDKLKSRETTASSAYDDVKQTQKEVEREQKKEQIDETTDTTDTDDTPEFDVQKGQWWRLPRRSGDPHLIYCGDSANNEFIDQLSEFEVSFAFADPPYNADAAEWDGEFKWQHDYLTELAEVVAVTPGIESIKSFMRRTSMPYEWSVTAWIDNGMTRGALGFGNWIYIGLFTDAESIHRESQDIARVSVRTSESDETNHKGRKPTELMEWLFDRFDGNDVIADPFLGSGTTLLTGHEFTDSRVIGAEIRPDFCEEILSRYSELTGTDPEVIQ
jgi:DNA modification methylase